MLTSVLLDSVLIQLNEVADAIFVVDIDQDGFVDVLTAGNEGVFIHRNDGNTNFTSRSVSASAASFLQPVDFDNDGDIDILAANKSSGAIDWLQNGGDSIFRRHSVASSAGRVDQLVAVDLDNDADIDIAFSDSEDGTVAWFERTSDDSFIHRDLPSVSPGATSIHAVDVDNDSNNDLIVGSTSENTIWWYRNSGANEFSRTPLVSNHGGVSNFVPADLNGDGRFDLVKSSNVDRSISWHKNIGDQNFIDHSFALPPNHESINVFAVDFNGDSDVDFVSTSVENEIIWFDNNGRQNFSQRSWQSPFDIVDVQPIDFDADGDTDLIALTNDHKNVLWIDHQQSPRITNTSLLSTQENIQTAVDLDAVDPDDRDGTGLRFEITGGADRDAFSLHPITGVLDFNLLPDFESPHDANFNNIYEIEVTVTDADSLLDRQFMSVFVNDQSETLALDPFVTRSVPENSKFVIDVDAVALEDEEGSGLTYSFDAGEHQDLFNFDSVTGRVEFVTAPDFENPQPTNTFEITVTATDSNRLIAKQTIRVVVTDLVESRTGADLSVPENETFVVEAPTLLAELGFPSETFFLAGGSDVRSFRLDRDSGQLSFRQAPDYENPRDADGDNLYELELSVVDADGYPQSLAIQVEVTNVSSIDFVGPDKHAIYENVVAITSVQAVLEAGESDRITFSISGGADANLVSIDSSTGRIAFKASRDFEKPVDSDLDNSYEFIVAATNSFGLTAMQAHAVAILDVASIQFVSSNEFIVVENQNSIGRIQATSEAAGQVTYFMSGGADRDRFTVNPMSGQLSFVNTPDFEAAADSNSDNEYLVQVGVFDSAAQLNVMDLTVLVDDENEPPTIHVPLQLSSPESLIEIIDIESSDPENIEDFGLNYSITGGADAGLFRINSRNGQLRFASAPDFEQPADQDQNNVYQVEITLTDAGQLTDSQLIEVQVTDIVSPAILGNYSVSNPENQLHVVDIQTVSDNLDDSNLVFRISGGDDQRLFLIDAATGIVRFRNLPDFESPTDANSDNIYEFRVQVEDSRGQIDATDVSVEIRDVPDDFPRVKRVLIQSNDWTDDFKDNVLTETGGFINVPLNASERNLPWKIDTVRIVFDREVNVDLDDLVITSANGAAYEVRSMEHNGATATWHVDTIVNDRILLNLNDTVASAESGWPLDGEFTLGSSRTGNGLSGGVFRFGLDTLIGDVNDDDVVNESDLIPILTSYLSTKTSPFYDFAVDLTGDGEIQSDELVLMAQNLGTRLPDGLPTAGDFLIDVPAPDVRQSYLPIGINPGRATYFDSQITFVDATLATKWHSDWSNWSTGIPLDRSGSPLVSIPHNGQVLFTVVPIHTDLPHLVDANSDFTLVLEGTLSVRIVGVQDDYDSIYSCNGGVCRYPIRFEPGQLNVVMEISTAEPGAKWSLYLPGFDESSSMFHPAFMDSLRGFEAIRDINWTRVNGSEQVVWSDRTLPEQKSQGSDAGVAYEHFVALTNELDADPWITIPHLANDNYVKQLAKLLKQNVEVGRKLYIEYSNEVWNGAAPFTQSDYVIEQGTLLFPDVVENSETLRKGTVSVKFYAKRSAEVFRIFEEVFNDPSVLGNHNGDSLVKTLSWQAAISRRGEEVMQEFNSIELNPTGIKADALAIAPYLHVDLIEIIFALEREVLMATTGSAPDKPDSRALSKAQREMVLHLIEERYSSDVLVDLLFSEALPKSTNWINRYKAIADEYEIELIAYEGGQHLVPKTIHIQYYPVWEQFVYDANRNPRIQDVLTEYHRAWFESGAGIHVGLGFVQEPRNGTAFGLMEYLGEDDAAKWQAMLNLMYGDIGECIAEGNCGPNEAFTPPE